MQQRAKRHHYIPQFWIKRWADSTGFVKRYRRFGQRIDVRTEPPKSVGYFRNLYDLPTFFGPEASLEELFFKPLDDKTSKVFQILDKGTDLNLSGEDAGTLGVFILSLLHRTPEGLSSVKRVADGEYRKALEDLRSSFEAEKVDAFEASQPQNASEIHFYRYFPKLVTSEKLVSFIMNMHWRILNRDKSTHPLLLSDDPIARTNGFERPEGHFAFPLSPDKLVIACYDKSLADEVMARDSRTLFAKLNEQTVGAARHFVVSNSERHTRFISNRFGRRLRPPFGEQMINQPANRQSPE